MSDFRDGASHLTVVGSGIKAVVQFTREAEYAIRAADAVFALVANPVTEEWIRRLASVDVEDLTTEYSQHDDRLDAYGSMIDRVVESVVSGKNTCAVFYGHPGVFAFPPHALVREVRRLGYSAAMIPGVSSEDCMISDLGIDPGITGWQSYEANAILRCHPKLDSRVPLVVWQLGMIGNGTAIGAAEASSFDMLKLFLLESGFPGERPVHIYRAAESIAVAPQDLIVSLAGLVPSMVSPVDTILVLGDPESWLGDRHRLLYGPPSLL